LLLSAFFTQTILSLELSHLRFVSSSVIGGLVEVRFFLFFFEVFPVLCDEFGQFRERQGWEFLGEGWFFVLKVKDVSG
jgi:hypothetical protein